jgi:hypothetical protein
MDWKGIGAKLLGIGAPILGTALGGPVGGLAAKTAISMIAKKFGFDEKEITADTVNAFVSDPEHQIKLRELEIEGEVQLRKLMNEETNLYLSDVQSARQMNVETTKATGERDLFMYILAALVVGGFFLLTGFLMFHAMPESSTNAAYMLFGALIGGFERVCSYFFGSSKGSKDKDKVLASKL